MSNNDFYHIITSSSTKVKLAFPKNGSLLDFFDNDSLQICNVPLHNARLQETSPTVAKQGFCCLNLDTSISNPNDKVQLEKEVEQLTATLLQTLGGKAALNLGHVVRTEISTGKQPEQDRPPAPFVHADWNEERIAQLGENLDDKSVLTNEQLTTHGVQQFMNESEHWAIYNLWVPLKLVTNRPLALCDMATVRKVDILKDIQFKNQTHMRGNILSLQPHSQQQWYYYPLMQSNEALLFMQYDSAQDRADFRPVFHSAIKLIDSPDFNTSPRQSIEFRFIVRL